MRSIKELFSPMGLSHIKLVPTIIWEIKNRCPFLMNYIMHKKIGGPYRLRKGYEIICQDFDDLGTISEVVLKKCYGNDFSKHGTILDIGANTGISAIYLASRSGESKILAYEPFQSNYNQIKKQIAKNKLEKRITVYQLGVDKTAGFQKLYLAEQSVTPNMYNITHSDKYIEIPTTTINDIIEKNNLSSIDLIKMDCEGAEFDILYGASDENIQKIKEIRMEYHDIFENDKKRNSTYLKTRLQEKGFMITKERIQPHAKNCGFIRCKRKNEKK